MSAFETSTTVGGQGEIHLAGVPFQPGTEVAVVVSPKLQRKSGESSDRIRLKSLLAALDRGRNVESVGPLRREELYDRDHVH